MKLISEKLYLAEHECCIGSKTLNSARYRGTDETFVFIRDLTDGWLVQYDALKPEYKLAINQKYNTGCLYQWFKDNGFIAVLKPDADAYLFFTRYQYHSGKFLKKEYVDAYLLAAQVLNAIFTCKKGDTIIDLALAYINANNISLPSTRETLLRKLRQYKIESYSAIVSKKFGNKCAEKEKDMALLRQLAGRPNNYDHALIAFDYNRAAVANGLPTLSESRVYQIATSPQVKMQINGQRKGMNAWRNEQDLIVSRKRPSCPLLLTVHDGFDWELYYQKQVKNKDGHNVTRHHFRKNVVVVVDAFNDYPLGFAIGDGENSDLIRLALKNAAMHVAELTGGYHLQHEIKSDNFAKGMQQFYGLVATHVSPSAVGNARDKVVESWFKRFNDKYTIRHHNYSGKNITSRKENQPNSDFLNKHKSSFPDETGVIMQIVNDIEAQRAEKLDQWLTGWNNTPAEKKRPISREEYLELFATGYTERELTNLGLQIQVRGNKYLYMLLEHDFVSSIGVKLQVKFDMDDMSSVLAIDEINRRKWLVAMKEMMPMARMDAAEGDRTRLNRYLEMKDERIQNVIDANTSDMEELMSRTDAEGIIKGFFTYNGGNKGIQADAKRALVSPKNETEDVEIEFANAFTKPGSLKIIE